MDPSLAVGLASLAVGVASVAAAYGVRYATRISWASVRRAVLKLEREVRRYDPDVLVGLADGGVVAGIIATNFRTSAEGGLRFHPYCTLGVQVAYSASGAKHVSLLGTDSIRDLTGKRVLVVDNHLYTGATLQAAVEFLRTKNPSEIRTLVLFKLELDDPMCEPTYFAYSIRRRRKRVPWSLTREHEAVYRT